MRRILSGLVLAAVFAMHGVPLLATDGGPHGMAASSESVMAMSAPAAAASAAETALLPSLPHAQSKAGLSDQSHGAPLMPDQGSHMHLWAACLAVLLAGMTLLVSAALLRRAEVAPVRGPTARLRWPSGWVHLPRPPDLFELCLLRT